MRIVCTKDGWILTVVKTRGGHSTIHADSRRAWRAMCDECQQRVSRHKGLASNSGSREPPEIGENPRGKKSSVRKKRVHELSAYEGIEKKVEL